MYYDPRWLLAQFSARLPAGVILLVEADELSDGLQASRPDLVVQAFSTVRQSWISAPDPMPTTVILGFSQAKEKVRMQLAMLAEFLPAGTMVYLYGGKNSGISSAPKLMAEYFGDVEKSAYGGHAVIWQGKLISPRAVQGLSAWQKPFQVEIKGQSLSLITLPGVFSHGDIDVGTRLLLEHLPLLPEGARVHDVGCGCGVITAFLKQRQPSLKASASDIDELALSATQATLSANGIEDVTLHLTPGLEEIEDGLDVIISNPPFHTGSEIDRSIADDLFTLANEKLNAGGQIIIVGNRFLPYKSALSHSLGPTEVLAETRQFWVLRGVKGN